MKILNDIGNLLYDSENPLCGLKITSSQGNLFAFVTCLDIGGIDREPEKCDQRQYWGEYSHSDPEGAIKEILHTGGKWSKFEP